MALSKVYSNDKALNDLNTVFKLTNLTKDEIARDRLIVDLRIVYPVLVNHLTSVKTYATPGSWPVVDCYGNPLKTDFGRICAAITLARHRVQTVLNVRYESTHTRYGKGSSIYRKHQGLALIPVEHSDLMVDAMDQVMRERKMML
ncbi:MAG: hypothetical protein QXN55_00705 [Candidatus Nitrosotenuis sp.]